MLGAGDMCVRGVKKFEFERQKDGGSCGVGGEREVQLGKWCWRCFKEELWKSRPGESSTFV